MHDLSVLSMLKQGWPILSILLAMSVISLAVFIDRWRAFRRIRCDAVDFVREVIRVAEERGLNVACAACEKRRLPIARTILAVLKAQDSREARDDAMTHAIAVEAHQLEMGVSLIGTIASLAPFVGLLGTVIGIIKAFGSIATNAGGGTDVISAGIAEALVTTACGLLVAIPSVASYNYCVHRIKNVARETELAVYELIVWLSAREASQLEAPFGTQRVARTTVKTPLL